MSDPRGTTYERIKELEAECDRYRAALERIAGEDYRGNRPMSATIAYQALNGGDDE